MRLFLFRALSVAVIAAAIVAGCSAPAVEDQGEEQGQAATDVSRTPGAVEDRVGCGTRGGPGYRGPDGTCVSHEQLATVCGDPPTLRCTAENVRGTE